MSIQASELVHSYLEGLKSRLDEVSRANADALAAAGALVAEQVANDRLVHIYGPGGHSNLASQELFFRAGGLMHIAAILDEGTLMSSGALRSMAMERTPGYGRVVIENARLGQGDLLILVNAYGMNAALIDAAITARERGVRLIGVSSREHAEGTAPDHPARHPTRANLHDVVDLHLDSQVPIGDAIVEVPGISQRVAPVSTVLSAFLLHSVVLHAVAELVRREIDPPIWRSGNAPGGDAANGRHIDRFIGRIRAL